jgi:hypothetical protein
MKKGVLFDEQNAPKGEEDAENKYARCVCFYAYLYKTAVIVLKHIHRQRQQICLLLLQSLDKPPFGDPVTKILRKKIKNNENH